MCGDVIIHGNELMLEDHGGRRMFLSKLNGIKKFEKRMLSESDCPAFLPMKFISEGANDFAYYDFTGCMQISEYLKIKELETSTLENRGEFAILVLNLIGDLFQCLKQIEKYLIFPCAVSVDPDAIFIEAKSGKTLLAYIENPMPEQQLQKRIIDSIEKVALSCNDTESKQHIMTLVRQIKENNPGLDGMINMLDIMKRNIHYIYWVPENFRNCESDIPFSDETEDAHRKQTMFEARITKMVSINHKSIWVLSFMTGASALCLGGAYHNWPNDIDHIAGVAILVAGVNILLYRKLKPKKKESVK